MKGVVVTALRAHRGRALLTGLVVVLATGSCSSAPSDEVPAAEDAAAPLGGLEGGHVHSLAVNPADEVVLAATHDGLFELRDDGAVLVGPVIDLMGFAVVGPDHFRASGHPGPGTDMPNPVGLIESVDGGTSWSPLSREGVSDFHALATWEDGVIAVGDGLERSEDLTSWQQVDGPQGVFDLASADGRTVLATTEGGVQRSTDAGETWQLVPQAPRLAFVEFVDSSRVFGVTPVGDVAVSTDAGATWEQQAKTGAPLALAATASGGVEQVLVLTEEGVQTSSDGGESFRPWSPTP